MWKDFYLKSTTELHQEFSKWSFFFSCLASSAPTCSLFTLTYNFHFMLLHAPNFSCFIYFLVGGRGKHGEGGNSNVPDSNKNSMLKHSGDWEKVFFCLKKKGKTLKIFTFLQLWILQRGVTKKISGKTRKNDFFTMQGFDWGIKNWPMAALLLV